MIKVLIVEDSLTAQVLLKHILGSDAGIQVVGTASNGLEALKFMQNNQPDLITMDLHMPIMDGLEATRTIMETKPVPILIVSNDWESANKADAFDYLEAGALAALEKPQGAGDDSFQVLCKELIQTVKIMSEIKVIKRYPVRSKRKNDRSNDHHGLKLIVIGASTGGPPVLKTILSSISEGFDVPIVVVQHIAKGFLPGLSEWLDASCALPVVIGEQGQQLQPGHVYLAPDEYETGVSRQLRIHLSPSKSTVGPCPSVSFLFRSALVNFGPQAMGVLLSGMGKDGAEELALMKQKGSVTIAQNEETCVVFGMPGAAVKLNGATYVLPPEKIGPMIERTVSSRSHKIHREGK